MKIHSNGFKDAIKVMGRETDSYITYGNNALRDELYSISMHYEGDILKSVMKQLDIETTVEIPINTVINFMYGVKVQEEYEYINYGNFVVYSIEKQEDTNLFKIICYDKMLFSMRKNEDLGVSYPITIKSYLNALANKIGLILKDTSFNNQSIQITSERYLGLEYTYRDILDEIAQATGSIICINANDHLEVKYPVVTGDTIDEEFLKDVNVNFA